MVVRSIALAVVASSLLFACGNNNDSASLAPQASTDDALSVPAGLACAIHYYDSASLPNPHIFVAAEDSAQTSSLSSTPLVLATPEGIEGTIGVYTKGFVTATVTSGPTFLTSGTYMLSTSSRFITDLQVPMTPVLKDGITYDRLWIGCGPTVAAAEAATPPVAK